MRWPTTSLMLSAVLAFGGCASVQVGADFDPTMSFAGYDTFAWGPADLLPTGDPRLDANPFLDRRVRSAVTRALEDRGFRAGDSSTAGLLLHYHAAVQERIDVFEVDQRYGYSSSGYLDHETRVHQYEQGTLIVDLVDRNQNRSGRSRSLESNPSPFMSGDLRSHSLGRDVAVSFRYGCIETMRAEMGSVAT